MLRASPPSCLVNPHKTCYDSIASPENPVILEKVAAAWRNFRKNDEKVADGSHKWGEKEEFFRLRRIETDEPKNIPEKKE